MQKPQVHRDDFDWRHVLVPIVFQILRQNPCRYVEPVPIQIVCQQFIFVLTQLVSVTFDLLFSILSQSCAQLYVNHEQIGQLEYQESGCAYRVRGPKRRTTIFVNPALSFPSPPLQYRVPGEVRPVEGQT